jgi:hypothetical protein
LVQLCVETSQQMYYRRKRSGIPSEVTPSICLQCTPHVHRLRKPCTPSSPRTDPRCHWRIHRRHIQNHGWICTHGDSVRRRGRTGRPSKPSVIWCCHPVRELVPPSVLLRSQHLVRQRLHHPRVLSPWVPFEIYNSGGVTNRHDEISGIIPDIIDRRHRIHLNLVGCYGRRQMHLPRWMRRSSSQSRSICSMEYDQHPHVQRLYQSIWCRIAPNSTTSPAGDFQRSYRPANTMADEDEPLVAPCRRSGTW